MAVIVDTNYAGLFNLPNPVKQLNPVPTDARYVIDTYAEALTFAQSGAISYVGEMVYVKDTDKIYRITNADAITGLCGLKELGSGGIKYVPTNGYTSQEFKQNDFIEWKGKAYVCLANVVGADGNKPDTSGGVSYWKPMNSSNVIGGTANGNCLEGDIWYDTTNN